jgi:two-component system alkaline phosphatase synthesis response regulator PhoP
LLAFLAQHRGRVFDRCQLLKVIHSYDDEVAVRTIDAHIKNIRRKIESDPRQPQYIVSVYGMGYKFVGP